jgi:hypothetical protein
LIVSAPPLQALAIVAGVRSHMLPLLMAPAQTDAAVASALLSESTRMQPARREASVARDQRYSCTTE